MRHFLLRSLVVIPFVSILSPLQISAATKSGLPDKPNFSGNWTLDVQSSSSLEALMKQIGASPLDAKYATSTALKAALQQTEDILTVATRGPGFALDQTLYLDGRSDPNNLQLLGATSINTKTAWSKDYKELVETHQIKTKQGKEGQLIVKRNLINGGKTLVVAFILQIKGESDEASARQIWHKQV
jgi:hypothetical protein